MINVMKKNNVGKVDRDWGMIKKDFFGEDMNKKRELSKGL